MTKSELIQHIADINPHLYHRDVERIVTTIFDEISEALSRGLDRLSLPMMGRVWSFDAIWDLGAMSKYGTVTSLAQSPNTDE